MSLMTSDPSATRDENGPLIPAASRRAFFLVTGLFFLWGIPHNLNDVLIRQFSEIVCTDQMQAGLVQSAFILGTFCSQFRAPRSCAGMDTSMACWLVSSSTALALSFSTRQRMHIAIGYFSLRSSSSHVGRAYWRRVPIHWWLKWERRQQLFERLNVSQAFFPLGAIVGVLIGTIFIFSGIELKSAQVAQLKLADTYQAYLTHETMRVIAPYMVLGVFVLLWGFIIWRTPLPSDCFGEFSDGRGVHGQLPCLA